MYSNEVEFTRIFCEFKGRIHLALRWHVPPPHRLIQSGEGTGGGGGAASCTSQLLHTSGGRAVYPTQGPLIHITRTP